MPNEHPVEGVPRLLTVHQVAELLATTPSKVRELARAGEIPVVRLGHRTLRYPLDAITALIARNTLTPAQEAAGGSARDPRQALPRLLHRGSPDRRAPPLPKVTWKRDDE